MIPGSDHNRSAHLQKDHRVLGLQKSGHSIAKPLLYHAVTPAYDPEVFSPSFRLYQYAEARPSPGKGLGLFASCFIPAGTRFLSEAPLLALNPGEDAPELYERFNGLSPPVQSYIRCFTSSQHTRRQAGMRFKLARRGFQSDQISTILELISVFQANAFKLEEGHKMFPQIARINHSCRPNAHTHFSAEENRMQTHALQDIKRGMEIEISYWNIAMPRNERQRAAAERGFCCECCVCVLRDDGVPNELELIRIRTSEVIRASHRLSCGIETGGLGAHQRIVETASSISQYLEDQSYCDPSLPTLYLPPSLYSSHLSRMHARKLDC